MPSSYSTSLRLELQETGSNVNTWGDRQNNNVITRLDSAIAGFSSVALTGDYSLTVKNGLADEARSAMIKFTGTLTLGATVTIPSVSKIYLLWNATNKVVTITTGAGATVALDPNDKKTVFCDGTNVYEPGFNNLGLKDYIASAVLAATGSLPSVSGNASKFLYTDGSSAFWRAPVTTDLADIATYKAAERAFAVAMALAL